MIASLNSHKKWKPLRTALPIFAASLVLTSCISGGGDSNDDENGKGSKDQGQGGKQTPIAQSKTTATRYGDGLQLSIYSLQREGNDAVTLNMSASNVGEEEIKFFQALTFTGDGKANASGVTLVDTQNMRRHWPLRKDDSEGSCLCSEWKDLNLAPGESVDFWVAFPAPSEKVKQVTVTTPTAPDFFDVPITKAETPKEEVTEASVQDPEVLDISSFQDDLDSETSREETNDETSIMLSSDVLFDTNKSELKPKAEKSLEQVAKEIDNSSAKTIKIDGYTDNTGNDSINQPLSEDRAKAVESKLKELVTREGVSFETAGHGSNYPVGDNDTEEGRQKNRRVTVTFEK